MVRPVLLLWLVPPQAPLVVVVRWRVGRRMLVRVPAALAERKEDGSMVEGGRRGWKLLLHN